MEPIEVNESQNTRKRARRRLRDLFIFGYYATKARREGTYGPLNFSHKEFRILRVEPGSGDDPVKCSLRRASLRPIWCPSYETISYCWGDENVHSTAEVNGIVRQVPLSSVQAIKRMRRPLQKRTLWIDAICIDQSNLDERSEQVSLMKEIYNQSDGNLVYLGEADESTHSAIENIGLIIEEIKQEFLHFEQFRRAVLPHYYGDISRSETGYHSDLNITALASFFSRAYFRRLWVLPETLVAPSSLCHCGVYELPLISILRASVWLRYKSPHLDQYGDSPLYAPSLLTWWECLEWKQTERQSIFFEHPGELYYFSRSREAADPRDRVFALVGLLSGEIPKALVPDYRQPLVEVLREARRYSFIDGDQLNCSNLCHAVHSDPIELQADAQPSWIPNDYDVISMLHSPLGIFQAHGETSGWVELSAEQLEAYWNPPHPDELIVPGFAVETLTQCTSKLQYQSSTSDLMDWLVQIEGVTGIALSGNVVPERTSLLSNLIQSTAWHGRLANQEETLEGYSFFSFLDKESSLPPPSFLQSLVKEEAAARRYCDCFLRSCVNRVFLATSSGRFGLGPPLTNPGDLVTVLRGGGIPVVLRSISDDVYKFVGECHVEGIMFGEAWEAHQAAGGTDEPIRIR